MSMSNTLSRSKQEPFIVSTTYVDIRLHSVATKLEMTWDSFTINELVGISKFHNKTFGGIKLCRIFRVLIQSVMHN